MKLKNKRIVVIALLIINTIPFIAFQEKPKFDLKASIQRGTETYNAQCLSCHMEKGEGLEGVYPPLAKADYLMADKKIKKDRSFRFFTVFRVKSKLMA
jgi:mono/diheme cytochrome c family protein